MHKNMEKLIKQVKLNHKGATDSYMATLKQNNLKLYHYGTEVLNANIKTKIINSFLVTSVTDSGFINTFLREYKFPKTVKYNKKNNKGLIINKRKD